MNYINFNGELVNDAPPHTISNRAFRYGDGIFESIRIINGAPVFIKAHYQRLLAGTNALKIKLPDFFSEEFLTQKILELLKSNNVNNGGKVRLTVFRSGDGTYMPEQNNAYFLIEGRSIKTNLFELNNEGLLIELFKEIKKSKNSYSNYKTLNSLLYVLASVHAKENEMDDCLIINESGNIIESSSSNIFIVSNGVLYTPPLEDGCVGGIMRMNLINTALSNKIKVYESSLTPQNLLRADEIILTNAINGLQWVRGYKNKRYFSKFSKKMIELINLEFISSEKDLQENLK